MTFSIFLYQDIRIHSADLGILGTEAIKSSNFLDSLILGVPPRLTFIGFIFWEIFDIFEEFQRFLETFRNFAVLHKVLTTFRRFSQFLGDFQKNL